MSNFLTYRERISEGYNLIIGKPKALCFDAWYNCVKISKIKFSRVESITQVYRLKSWDLKALVCLLKNTTMNQLIFSGCILYYFFIVLTTNFLKKLRIKLYLNLIAMTSLTQNLAPIHQNAINALASDPYACLGAIVFLTTYASILKKSLSHFDLWNIFDKCWGRHVCRLDAGPRSKDE